MKKVLTIALIFVIALLSLTACSGNAGDNSATPTGSGSTTATPEKTPEATPNLALAQVGDIIQFGKLDWRVLALKDGKALILSENILGEGAYCEEGYGYNRWEISAVRSYFNDVFYSTTFSGEEQAKICETNLVNANNQWFEHVVGGNETRDKIFLLSLEEVINYFGDSGELAKKPDSEEVEKFSDEYNEARIALTVDGRARNWWLRSPGDRPSYNALIGYDGAVDVHGNHAKSTQGVRPALWLKLDGPALESDHDPIIEHPPVTYITKNGTFAMDIPFGVDMTSVETSGTGDQIRLQSWTPIWTIDFYEEVPKDSDYTINYYQQKDVITKSGDTVVPITIIGKEGYYYSNDSYSSGIWIGVNFPNPLSDDKKAIYGGLIIMMDPIEGYTTADYLEIPGIKAILDSIRVPE